jgi:hypothetical protein
MPEKAMLSTQAERQSFVQIIKIAIYLIAVVEVLGYQVIS